MNLPNKLTVSRFVLTALFLWAIFSRGAYNDTLALLFFALAGFTDFLDGRIARQRNLITTFGILMDPLADKILTCSAFVALVERHALNPPPVVHLGPLVISPHVEAWMVVIIVSRELAITGLRLLAASKNVVLAAERYGKHKTISQIVALLAMLLMEAAREWPPAAQNFLLPWLPAFAALALWVTIALTAISGLLYLSRNRSLYLDEM